MLDNIKKWIANFLIGDAIGSTVRHAITAFAGYLAALGIDQGAIDGSKDGLIKLALAAVSWAVGKFLSAKNKTVV